MFDVLKMSLRPSTRLKNWIVHSNSLNLDTFFQRFRLRILHQLDLVLDDFGQNSNFIIEDKKGLVLVFAVCLPIDHRKDPYNFIDDLNLWFAGQNQKLQRKILTTLKFLQILCH